MNQGEGPLSGRTVRLYSYWRSSCSWRVRLALELKGIPYEYHAINLLADEQKSPEYLAINPAGIVPTLVVTTTTTTSRDSGLTEKEIVLNQSSGIIEYLEEITADTKCCNSNNNRSCNLLPKDSVMRAHTRALAQTIASETQPLQNLRVLKDLFGSDGAARERWAGKVIRAGLAAYEELVSRTVGTYSVGDEVSLADCHLVPQVYNARRFGINVATEFPIIHGICERLEGLEAFRKAHPDAQPDKPHQQ